MKKLIISCLLLCSSVAYSAPDPGGPPCNGIYPYVKADKTRDQVKYGWYNSWFWNGIWPARQATCQDWFYIWQPAVYMNGGWWQPAGYVWIADSDWFGQPKTITGFFSNGKIWLERQQTWYDYELNIIIQETAQLLNNRGIWWQWR